jgi:hypothetical protein
MEIGIDNGEARQAYAPVIISASRSTDIPAFYSEWLMNRLRRGYVKWLNPFSQQHQYISFSKTRLIVFWTKDPRPLMSHLKGLDAMNLNYYFQFTLNDYDQEELEPPIPTLGTRIQTFQELSVRVGKKHVIWRFDPIILLDSLTPEKIVHKIDRIAREIAPYTERLVVSFADISSYERVKGNLGKAGVGYREFTPELMTEVASLLQKFNEKWGLEISTCAEGVDLEAYGIERGRCIDDRLMVKLFPSDKRLMAFLGYGEDMFGNPSLPYLKDQGQRKECGCIMSKDIGAYSTCPRLCKYCYANSSEQEVDANVRRHRDDSETLVG